MCSKLQSDAVREAISGIMTDSKEKQRKFAETIELQIGLKNYDPQKDKRFSGSVKLPHIPRPKMRICMLGDAQHVEEVSICFNYSFKKNICSNYRAVYWIFNYLFNYVKRWLHYVTLLPYFFQLRHGLVCFNLELTGAFHFNLVYGSVCMALFIFYKPTGDIVEDKRKSDLQANY